MAGSAASTTAAGGTGGRVVSRAVERRAATLITAAILATACTADTGARLAGTCYDEPPRVPDDVPTVPCEDARFEIVSVDTLGGGQDTLPWPGDLELSRLTFDRCLDAAEMYAGAALPDRLLDVWFHHPTERGWEDGDRDFVCAVQHVDGEVLGGSVQGADA
jgi:hypothetical protein